LPQERGAATGPNPSDRGKPGATCHVLTDAKGIPLALRLAGANGHDSRTLEAVVDAVPPIHRRRGRKRLSKRPADKAYAQRRCRRALTRRRIRHSIARRGTERSKRLGRQRWIVERARAWFAEVRRLAIRSKRRVGHPSHRLHPGCSPVVRRFIERWFCRRL
jgi:transposase